MNIDDWNVYTKLPIRHKTLVTHVYILYISNELIETFRLINDRLKAKNLVTYKNPSLQWKNVTIWTEQLPSIQSLHGKPNTLVLNNIDDIQLIK